MTLNLICPDDGETTAEVTIDIEDIQIQKPEGHDNIIKLNDDVAITMKYPSMETFVKNNITGDSSLDSVFDLSADCIDQIVEGEDVYEAKSFSKKELLEFMDSMDSVQFQMVQKFFETMPKLSHTVEITNPKTGVKSDVVIEGLQSFSISSSHESLENYYRTNFVMVQHHKWDLEQLENMMPWEREVYVQMLIEFIEEENERIKSQQN